MGTVAELKDAVKDTLQRKGLMRQLQAHMRSQVFSILLDAEEDPRPEPRNENLIINELIREYLIYNGYRDTLSVFIPETGQPHTRPFDREFLVQQLGMQETQSTEQVPLIYSLAARQPPRSNALAEAAASHVSPITVQLGPKQQSRAVRE